MKYIELGTSGVVASNVGFGCLQLRDMTHKQAEHTVSFAIDQGINFFDNSDAYGRDPDRGMCQEIFGKAAHLDIPSKREKVFVQGKCGIVKGQPDSYDFSKEHILEATNNMLTRFGTEYIDFLVLHQPDTLMEPEEVAEAFEILHKQGKVNNFGVSNHSAMQVELLQKYVPFKLHVNQLQLSICHCPMIDHGLAVNMVDPRSVDRDGAVLEYSRLNDMTIQAWSPFRYGNFEGFFVGNYEKFPKLNEVMDKVADRYEVSKDTIAIAWILRHPANIQVLVGTTNERRLADSAKASEIRLTRQEWYEIYQAVGKKLP